MSELSEKVHELTRDHKVTIIREYEDGPKRDFVDRLSLYKQLELEVTAKSSSGGGGSPTNTRSLASLKALDLLIDIDKISAQYANPKLPVPVRIQVWSEGTEEEQALCLAWVTYWLRAIESLWETTLEVRGTCPQCEVAEFLDKDEDNSNSFIRKPTLVATTSYAYCRSCQFVWEGDHGLKELSSQI